MATAQPVSEVIKVKLLDNKTEVTLRQLSIRNQKEFMKEFGRLQDLEPVKKDADGNVDKDYDWDIEFMNILVNCAAIALKGQLPEQTAFLDDEDASRDDFEDLLDMNTVSKVNEICGGISFDADKNPNLQAAMGEVGSN